MKLSLITMELIQLIFLGNIIGVISSFFGIGGGSIIVPILYTLYPVLPASIVVPISLGSIFIVTTNNVYLFYKQKLLPPRQIAIALILSCLVGSIIGAMILRFIDTGMAKNAMAFILVLMVLKIIFYRPKIKNNGVSTNQSILPYAILGLLGSFLSSITGLGGGIIFTPALISILRVTAKKVPAYSNLAMVVATLFGVLPHFFTASPMETFENPLLNSTYIGNVNFGVILLIAFGGFISARLGVYFNGLVKEKTKKKLLSLILLIFALKLIL